VRGEKLGGGRGRGRGHGGDFEVHGKDDMFDDSLSILDDLTVTVRFLEQVSAPLDHFKAFRRVAFTPQKFFPKITKVVSELDIVYVGLETYMVHVIERIRIIEPLGPPRPGFEDDRPAVQLPRSSIPRRRRPVDIQYVLIDHHGGTLHPSPVVLDDIRIPRGDLGFEIFTGRDLEVTHTGVQEIILGITVLGGEHYLGDLGIPENPFVEGPERMVQIMEEKMAVWDGNRVGEAKMDRLSQDVLAMVKDRVLMGLAGRGKVTSLTFVGTDLARRSTVRGLVGVFQVPVGTTDDEIMASGDVGLAGVMMGLGGMSRQIIL